MNKTKRIALCGMLTALALALSLAERMIPLELIVPIPGIKLGLANVVTMFALLFLTPKEAYAILFCRVVLAALFAGSVTQLLFSLVGGMLALTTTWILLHKQNKWFSFYGISAASAAMHNIGQVLAAMLDGLCHRRDSGRTAKTYAAFEADRMRGRKDGHPYPDEIK